MISPRMLASSSRYTIAWPSVRTPAAAIRSRSPARISGPPVSSADDRDRPLGIVWRHAGQGQPPGVPGQQLRIGQGVQPPVVLAADQVQGPPVQPGDDHRAPLAERGVHIRGHETRRPCADRQPCAARILRLDGRQPPGDLLGCAPPGSPDSSWAAPRSAVTASASGPATRTGSGRITGGDSTWWRRETCPGRRRARHGLMAGGWRRRSHGASLARTGRPPDPGDRRGVRRPAVVPQVERILDGPEHAVVRDVPGVSPGPDLLPDEDGGNPVAGAAVVLVPGDDQQAVVRPRRTGGAPRWGEAPVRPPRTPGRPAARPSPRRAGSCGAPGNTASR
jgi:hypothetical protein